MRLLCYAAHQKEHNESKKMKKARGGEAARVQHQQGQAQGGPPGSDRGVFDGTRARPALSIT